MKRVEEPNGFVVCGQAGYPVLFEFGQGYDPIEIKSDEWLGKGKVLEDDMILVHSVRGDDSILIRGLYCMKLVDGLNNVTAMELSRSKKLFMMADKIYSYYMELYNRGSIELFDGKDKLIIIGKGRDG